MKHALSPEWTIVKDQPEGGLAVKLTGFKNTVMLWFISTNSGTGAW